jgi:hypothetical protein
LRFWFFSSFFSQLSTSHSALFHSIVEFLLARLSLSSGRRQSAWGAGHAWTRRGKGASYFFDGIMEALCVPFRVLSREGLVV